VAGDAVPAGGWCVPHAVIAGTEDSVSFFAATSDEDEQKVQRASVVLDQVLRERYPDADLSYDTEEPRLSWQYRADGMSTHEAMHDRAWNEPRGAVTFANEADPGTFGHENLGRLFRERMADTSMVAEPTIYPTGDRSQFQSRADDDNDAVAFQQFADDAAVEMPTDENVREYAAHLAVRSDQMRSLGEKGHCSTGAALEELDQFTPASAHRGSMRDRFEAYQLCRWVER